MSRQPQSTFWKQRKHIWAEKPRSKQCPVLGYLHDHPAQIVSDPFRGPFPRLSAWCPQPIVHKKSTTQKQWEKEVGKQHISCRNKFESHTFMKWIPQELITKLKTFLAKACVWLETGIKYMVIKSIQTRKTCTNSLLKITIVSYMHQTFYQILPKHLCCCG